MLLVKKLVQVHDAFQLRQEMLWMMGSCIICVGKHYVAGILCSLVRSTLHVILVDAVRACFSPDNPHHLSLQNSNCRFAPSARVYW